jgi:iron only hydrogenase large subunit-like protein
MNLPGVVDVNAEKCVNCHRCISACPVKYCNDGSGTYVQINHNLCIGCGECLKACEHQARVPIDDFDQAMLGLRKKEKIVAVVAPGIAANFPHQYLQFNGYLKSLGVAAVFDVSFGAELTVKSYLEHIGKNKPELVIAQPCPALVTYIEIYQTELLPYLAPADSPMMHTIKLIRNFYPQYAGHRTMIVSPCIAKKREFVEVGQGDYNVTMRRIAEHLEQNRISLEQYPAVDYDNAPAERAVLFSTPGGLLRTAMREVPGVEAKSRKIEGPHVIYDYFTHLKKDVERKANPLLLDCLNCDKGCNGGTGTKSQLESVDYLENLIEERNSQAIEQYRAKNPDWEGTLEEIRNTVNRFWKPNIYNRRYVNHSANNTIRIPNKSELKVIFTSMLKFEETDILNCNSCGYNSCEKMATAVFNNLNKIENCHLFLQKNLEKDKKSLSTTYDKINYSIDQLSREEIKRGHEIVQNMIQAMTNIVNIVKNSDNLIGLLYENNSKIRTHIQDIFKIAKQINLLSINASIESSKAGIYGKGFNIVAGEIKNLSYNTNNFTKEIDKLVLQIDKNTREITASIAVEKNEVDKGKEIAGELGAILDKIVEEVNLLSHVFEDQGIK